MRVNVQLLEAETASHIWAERFDKPVADLFDMQDEIVSRLANALGQELAHAEARRAERKSNPDSMDHYFLGHALGYTVANLDKARFHYDRALELDPNNVDALIARAWIDMAFAGGWLSEDRRERLLSAQAYVDKALKLSPDCAAAHFALGELRIYSNRAVQGIAECERALAIDRNFAAAHAHIGMAKLFLGRGEETEAHILEALRISPRDSNEWAWMIYVGTAKFHLGRDEQALAWLNRSIELNPNAPVSRFCLAATLAHLDRLEEAREAARACLELNPSFTIALFRSQTNSDNPIYLTGRERMYEGLRKAGMPEGGNKAMKVGIGTSAPQEPLAAPRLSIVVLPFANLGGDPEQDYFADGVTDSLTTDLSRIRGVFVIGRSTAFTYKGKAGDVRQIGRELNVRYVLEGSVQRGGNRLRVNVQLLEAETASHIWAERFDKPVADLFDMQDEIVSRLANGLGQELAGAEARRAERKANPDSLDHYFLGQAAFKGHTAAVLDKARFHFDRAVELDPDNVDALVARAWIDLSFVGSWLSEDRRGLLLSAEAYIDKALKLRPDSANAHCALGALRTYSNRAIQGIAECERALAIDRNFAAGHGFIGMAKILVGRNEDTEAHILEALRISPRDALAWVWMGFAGTAKIHVGHDEAALSWLNRSIELNPNIPVTRFCLAATLAHLDRIEEAREAARACLELNPSFTIARFRSQTSSDHPVYLAGRERMYEGLRKAGMPEQ
jgi:TolB-like protein/Flp pilus assembly protein TadD